MSWMMNKLLDELVKDAWRTCDNIWEIATGQDDDYATGCLLLSVS